MKAVENRERIKAGAGPKPVPRILLPTESEGTGRIEGCEAPSREDGPEGDTAAAKPATQRGAGRKEGCAAPRAEDSGAAAPQARSLRPSKAQGVGRIDATPVPSESVEQQRLFLWAGMQSGKYPCLTLMYHIPNEGKRSRATGGRLRAEGLKAGVPDICLPVARGGCHGLYIELKRQHGGRLLPAQAEWMEKLKAQGYQVALCHGWEAASEIILEYLKGGTDA